MAAVLEPSTRMRALAKLPNPMWWPSISTVSVPSGEAAVMVPDRPGKTSDASRNSSSPGVNSSSSGMRETVKLSPGLSLSRVTVTGSL